MLWLMCQTSHLEVDGLRPSPCHRVVSIDKKLYLILSLSTQVYKMGTVVTYCWGQPYNGQASHPGGSSNTLSCYML